MHSNVAKGPFINLVRVFGAFNDHIITYTCMSKNQTKLTKKKIKLGIFEKK